MVLQKKLSKDLLTADQAAKRLGYKSAKRIYQIIHEGGFPGVMQLMGRYLIPLKAVKGYKKKPVGWEPGRPRGKKKRG
jgi:excisionase family DNA binding protein